MKLVDYLLGGSVINYVGHRTCVRKASQSDRPSKRIAELSDLFEQQEQDGQQEKNRLHRATRNGAWLSAVPHRLDGTELSRGEFRDNLCLRYGLMPQDIPATYDGCGKKLSDLFERQEQAGGQDRNRLHRATMNGAWRSAVPHRLNGKR